MGEEQWEGFWVTSVFTLNIHAHKLMDWLNSVKAGFKADLSKIVVGRVLVSICKINSTAGWY